MIRRGDIYWADLGDATGSAPAKRRPVLVIQADPYNRSRLATVVVAVITSNTAAADHPGNVFLPSPASGLPRDSVINVTGIATLDRRTLDSRTGHLTGSLIDQLDSGLRTVLGLAAGRR